jgi:hypothetical protein
MLVPPFSFDTTVAIRQWRRMFRGASSFAVADLVELSIRSECSPEERIIVKAHCNTTR